MSASHTIPILQEILMRVIWVLGVPLLGVPRISLDSMSKNVSPLCFGAWIFFRPKPENIEVADCQ